MHPEICKIGPFTIYAYGLMLVLAFLVGSKLAAIQAQKEGVEPGIIFNFAFIAFIFGILGARLFYVIENLDYYMKNPLDIVMLQHGGLSWFGGLALGSFSGFVYLKISKLPVYKMLDLIVPFVALAQGIGRIGCLLNGCCFGKISKFGIYFKLHGEVLIPTQLYSSLTLIFIFIVLRFFQARPHKKGEIYFLYLILYALKRFFIEFWRADSKITSLGLTSFQIISIAVFSFAAIKLFLLKKSKN